MMLPAPQEQGPRNHLAYYVDLGINCIPLGVASKRPYFGLNDAWKQFQRVRVSAAQAQAWHIQAQGSHYGVGLICGRVSNGLTCLDGDGDGFYQWLLDRLDHPLLRGAWIVKTGSGKAHIWVRSQAVVKVQHWNLSGHIHVGEIRGEGSYAAAPPSLHPTKHPYETVAGSPEHILVVADAADLARKLADEYTQANPQVSVPREEHRQTFFEPDKEQREEISSRVRQAKFTRKIRDTLLKSGCYTPGEGYWASVTSHSDIDFALVCAMVRMGWSQDEAEWIFAGSEAAAGCYANKARHGSRGHSYWSYTWANAEKRVGEEKTAALIATGADFRVLEATAYGHRDPRFKLLMETMGHTGGEKRYEVIVTAEELSSESRFKLACLKQRLWQPRFTSGQRGHDFEQFTLAVANMLSDTEIIPDDFSTTGALEQMIMRQLQMCSPYVPEERGAVSIGWQENGSYYVVGHALFMAAHTYDHRLTAEQFGDIIRVMAYAEQVVYSFERGGTTRVLKITLKHGASPALSPPDAALDGS